MGLFSKFKDVVKEALPVIGGTVGFAVTGNPMGASIGAGIGTLGQGRSVQDALTNAAIGYAGGTALKGLGFTQAQQGATGISQFLPGREMVTTGPGPNQMPVTEPNFGIGSVGTVPAKPLDEFSTFKNMTFGEKAALGSLGIGALGASGLFEEVEEKPVSASSYYDDSYQGEAKGTLVGPISGRRYDLADRSERRAYNDELLQLQRSDFTYAADGGEIHAGGGEVDGPGTGTSDSVPARLSDGEFVLTAKAVRGAGSGDRDIGAARLYDMMAELEAND